MSKAEITFEDAMKNLEEIVEKLEEAEVPLEKAIQYYQQGMELSKLCSDKLKNVEEKMAQVIDAEGVIKPLKIEEDH
ncbi:exodeoxyribonuclease VII small subunit [Natronobacillus azotifigens]|uniref:Exodeoxyribonuclease 7 small subunit n=1 Tax=Natronobacillus azotifigens TaxID=472978 RepID=A0A9J6REL9_9BACI|nr:exodeoxyribonuclease VII small subunit [Natronobacillus azotifigens]MCZ0704096.1 exodeoxyribonuclease VII small subunit [Natronobacillus azotifigens]